MCSTNTSPLGLSGLLMETLLSSSAEADNDALARQYNASLLDLEHSQARTRLASEHSIANGTAAREKYQHKAAQEAGKAHTGHAASNLAMDSGSLLQLMGDQARQTQFESEDITRQTAQNVERQRLDEVHAGKKKELLQQEYQYKRDQAKSNTLLGGYSRIRNFLTSL